MGGIKRNSSGTLKVECVAWFGVAFAATMFIAGGPAVTSDQWMFRILVATCTLLVALSCRCISVFRSCLRRSAGRSLAFDKIDGAACVQPSHRPAIADIINSTQNSDFKIIATLITFNTALLAYSAYVHSPTLNEPAHLVAGLSHWRFGRFELYRVNPPLVRMLAVIPVLVAGANEDWKGFYEGPGYRPEIQMGDAFVAANGERSTLLFMIARWMCIPFSWLGAIICYLWARDLYGRASAVCACTIWCFEPNIVAHSSLMTPDAHAAALGVLSCYVFWLWLNRPSWAGSLICALTFGFALLAKTTFIVLLVAAPSYWFLSRIIRGSANEFRRLLHEATMLVVQGLLAIYILNSAYCFDGSMSRLCEYQFVSDSFMRWAGTEPIASLCANWPIPLPKDYLIGIDLQQSDFENYSRDSYLNGVWSRQGWWYYYLVASCVKIPLGLWCLCVLRLGIECGLDHRFATFFTNEFLPPANQVNVDGENGVRVKSDLADERKCVSAEFAVSKHECIVVFLAAVLGLCVSAKWGFSEHWRYAFPSFPLIFIWSSGVTTVRLTVSGFFGKLCELWSYCSS